MHAVSSGDVDPPAATVTRAKGVGHLGDTTVAAVPDRQALLLLIESTLQLYRMSMDAVEG